MGDGLAAQESKNEIVVYQPNETLRLEVRVENETVWLNRQQMAKLFGRDVKTIGKHITNALKEELAPIVANNATVRADGGTVAKFATVQREGGRRIIRMVEHYGLEMIASVGFRVKSPEGIVFRRWANRVLVDMMLQGVSVGRKYDALAIEMDRRFCEQDSRILELRKDVDFFISSSLPPKEKVFVEGKMLDAQVELTRIVKTAKRRLA